MPLRRCKATHGDDLMRQVELLYFNRRIFEFGLLRYRIIDGSAKRVHPCTLHRLAAPMHRHEDLRGAHIVRRLDPYRDLAAAAFDSSNISGLKPAALHI